MLKRILASVAGVLAIVGASAGAADARAFWVSQSGNNGNPCTKPAPCATISYAVGKAQNGDAVFVEAGTYRQSVRILKDVHLHGLGRPIVNLAGLNSAGFEVYGRGAAGAEIGGFLIENAAFEGILVQNTSKILINNDIVRNNDKGAFVKHPTGECAPSGRTPGDCGEAIHLIHVRYSTLRGILAYGNSGGVLLSDETGPTAYNLILGNIFTNNLFDSGVTLAGHNPLAVASAGKRGGVYANTIRHNGIYGNGTKGEGAGVMMAAALPGEGVWSNLIEANKAVGNGLAGVTIHAHASAEDLNGNRILDNVLRDNGVADQAEAAFGENNGKSRVKVDILVGSAVVKLKGIMIKGNVLRDAHYGVFTKNDIAKVRQSRNTFIGVVVPVSQT